MLRSAFAVLLVLLGGGCARTVMSQPIDRKGDGWTLVVRKITDGPNRFDKGNVVLEPAAGERFIWITVTLRNDQRQKRTFNFDRCDLDSGSDLILPRMVNHDMAIGYATELNREPEMAPGESIDRRLVFVYPADRSPTRLRCEPMVYPLPQF